MKFALYNYTNEVIDEHFQSLCSIYQKKLQISIRGNDFISDLVQ